MRVAVFPADRGGCGFYRMIEPARVLAAAGADVHLDPVLQATRVAYRVAAGSPFDGSLRVEERDDLIDANVDADVVVFQRPLQADRVELIRRLQANGVAVVVEIDDDFHALPKRHPARRDTAALHNKDVNRGWLRLCCDAADLVTCSTPPLAARYAPHGRVRVLPNLIPASYLDIRRPEHDGPPRVGWTGSTVTHPGDLEASGGGIAAAVADTDAELWVIGTGRGVPERVGCPVDHATGWVELDDYPAAYADLDVAVVPLELNQFNESKSWLKGLEAAAVGVPFVASPTGPYRRFAEMGAGRVAGRPVEWRAEVSRLVSDAAWRAEVSSAGRDTAAMLTYEEHAWRWLEAWEAAAVHRRSCRKREVPV